MDFHHALLLPSGKFVLIKVIDLGMVRAEEQQRRANLPSARFLDRALLQEAVERGDSAAGADHDDRHRGVFGRVKGGLRGPILVPATFLANNDATSFFRQTDGLIVCGGAPPPGQM